uniref:Tube Death domain-containing protein n=1 Tax=Glossina morsitans morsitans TaxID=37546 RepID=A0A905ATG9_GLOMM
MSSYSRETELRHLHQKDSYELSLILDDNEGWLDLIQVIPKKIDNESFNLDESIDSEEFLPISERKYNNDHIRLIQNAVQYHGDSRLFSEILFDEWGTSGRKHERPTLGVLLNLLLKAKLIRAANFLAKNLLKEPLPRPTAEAAVKIADTSLPSEIFKDIEDMVFDSEFYPTTEMLNENDQSLMDNNKDFYTKYLNEKHITTTTDSVPPKPPPRLSKSSRLQTQQQNSIQMHGIVNSEENENIKAIAQNEENISPRNGQSVSKLMSPSTPSLNLPLLSILVKPRGKRNDDKGMRNADALERRETDTFQKNGEDCVNRQNENMLDSNLPLLSIFEKPFKAKTEQDIDRNVTTDGNLPNIKNGDNDVQKSEKNMESQTTVADAITKAQLINTSAVNSNLPLLSIFEKYKNINNGSPTGCPIQQNAELLHEGGVSESERNVPLLSILRNTERKPDASSQAQLTNNSFVDPNLPLLSILTKPYKLQSEERSNHGHIDNYNQEELPSLSRINLSGACNVLAAGKTCSSTADCNKVLESDHSTGNNSNFLEMKANNNESSVQLHALNDDFNMNKNNDRDTSDVEGDGEEDDDNSLPNLSIFDQASSNNDSSLTNVTGTSGENSFDLSLNDCSSASDNVPSLGALKQ